MPNDSPQKKDPDAPKAPEGPRRIADEPVVDADAPEAGVRDPLTESGLPVEEQIRKEWDPNKNGGLPIPLRGRTR